MSRTQHKTKKVECVGLFGPMKPAWEQTFQPGMKALAPCLIILWHSEWMYHHHGLWDELRKKLKAAGKGTRILVVVFGETPDDLGEEHQGNPLGVVLRALITDAAADSRHRGCGWASISDVSRFRSASIVWKPTPDSALMRLCKVCALLSTWPKKSEPPDVTVAQFFHFLADPVRFRASILHGADKPDQERRRLCELKWLVTLGQIQHSMPLKILVVENDPKGLCSRNLDAGKRHKPRQALPQIARSPLRYLSSAEYYVIHANFGLLRAESYESVRATKCCPDRWDQRDSWANQAGDTSVPWAEIDLVLQDVMLGQDAGRITGLTLAPFYFEACPQALVFLLTGLDIESLVVSGDVNWKYVDAVIPKDGLENLWFEYRRCFLDRFGRMFWPSWSASNRRDDHELMRGLFGSLRKWQIEPDILWHGQNLPEMIDHANRHITALWRLVNDFVVTLVENGGASAGVLTLRRRIALAVATWMHDVGHRGDEYVGESTGVRASHAGISERLLLRNPDAYGLGWLLRSDLVPYALCQASDVDGRAARLECRNETTCRANGSSPLCLLREVGLLCRHHQSNAPLDGRSSSRMASRGKEPSVYSLVPDSMADATGACGSTEHFLRAMANDSVSVPCPSGTLVRTLDEFVVQGGTVFACVAGLLRMLDALQLHRSRVGSSASIKSFNEFLDTRLLWCATERQRLEHALRSATPGTLAFQRVMEDLQALGENELLLTTQQVHHWRQAVAHDVQVLWRWRAHGEAAVDIAYTLNEQALAVLADMSSILPNVAGVGRQISLLEILAARTKTSHVEIDTSPKATEISAWILNVREEVVEPEHKSQYGSGLQESSFGYLGVLADKVSLRVVVAGTDQSAFGRGNLYVIHER